MSLPKKSWISYNIGTPILNPIPEIVKIGEFSVRDDFSMIFIYLMNDYLNSLKKLLDLRLNRGIIFADWTNCKIFHCFRIKRRTPIFYLLKEQAIEFKCALNNE